MSIVGGNMIMTTATITIIRDNDEVARLPHTLTHTDTLAA